MTKISKERWMKLAGVPIKNSIQPAMKNIEVSKVQKKVGRLAESRQNSSQKINEWWPEDGYSECQICHSALDLTNPKDDTEEGICEDCLEDELIDERAVKESSYHMAKNDQIAKVVDNHVTEMLRELSIDSKKGDIVFDDLFHTIKRYLSSVLS